MNGPALRISDFEHSGLAGAVAADQGDFLSARHAGGEARDHLQIVVGLGQTLELQGMPSGGALHVKPDVRPLDIGSGQFGGLDALDFLFARSHLRGARAGRKAGDELIELRDFLLAHGVIRFDARANLRLGQDHVVVTAGVHDDRLVVDVGNVRAYAVQKMPVVRDHQQRAV